MSTVFYFKVVIHIFHGTQKKCLLYLNTTEADFASVQWMRIKFYSVIITLESETETEFPLSS